MNFEEVTVLQPESGDMVAMAWSIIAWPAVIWYSARPIVTMQVHVTNKDYINILNIQIHKIAYSFFSEADAVQMMRMSNPLFT